MSLLIVEFKLIKKIFTTKYKQKKFEFESFLSSLSLFIDMEGMDESKASDYYRRRMLVAVFGQWVSAVCAAAEMDLQATSVYQLHAKAQGLTRLEQYLHRRIHSDDKERLGATMYCLLLLHRGIQRWSQHLRMYQPT